MMAGGGFVVTACGLVSAAGDTPSDLLNALERTTRAGEIQGFDPKRYIDRKGLGNLSRASQLACAAAARLAPDLAGVPAGDVGVVFGTAFPTLQTIVDFERSVQVDGHRFVDPFLFAETVPNVPAGQISILCGWAGFNLTVSSGSASGIEAVCAALDALEEGRGKVVVAGGGDPVNPSLLRVLDEQGRLCRDGACRPFSAEANGFMPGEGACLFALEAMPADPRRAAHPLGRVMGWARGSAGPDDGAPGAGVLAGLLESARVAPRDVDLVIASANGAPRTDRLEGLALIEALGRGDAAPPVLVPKAVLGETWGASGPFAIAIGLEVLRTGHVPSRMSVVPAPGLEHLNLNGPVRGKVRRVLVSGIAETGAMAAVLLERAEGGDAA